MYASGLDGFSPLTGSPSSIGLELSNYFKDMLAFDTASAGASLICLLPPPIGLELYGGMNNPLVAKEGAYISNDLIDILKK